MKHVFISIIVSILLLSCNNDASSPSRASISNRGQIVAYLIGQPQPLDKNHERFNFDPEISILRTGNEKNDSIMSELMGIKMAHSIDYPYDLLIDSSGFKLANGTRVWTDNIDELVGSLIQTDPKGPNGRNIEFRILNNILGDTVKAKTKIYTPRFSDTKNITIKSDQAASFSFLGINPNIKKEQLYTLAQSSVAGIIVSNRDLDTLKIPTSLKCTLNGPCNTFVIMGAEVVKFETRLYSARTKALKVKDFPLVSQAFGNGSELEISSNSSSDQQQTSYFLYIVLKSLGTALGR